MYVWWWNEPIKMTPSFLYKTDNIELIFVLKQGKT